MPRHNQDSIPTIAFWAFKNAVWTFGKSSCIPRCMFAWTSQPILKRRKHHTGKWNPSAEKPWKADFSLGVICRENHKQGFLLYVQVWLHRAKTSQSLASGGKKVLFFLCLNNFAFLSRKVRVGSTSGVLYVLERGEFREDIGALKEVLRVTDCPIFHLQRLVPTSSVMGEEVSALSCLSELHLQHPQMEHANKSNKGLNGFLFLGSTEDRAKVKGTVTLNQVLAPKCEGNRNQASVHQLENFAKIE